VSSLETITQKFLRQLVESLKAHGLERLLEHYNVKVRGKIVKGIEAAKNGRIVKLTVNDENFWFFVGSKSVHYLIPRIYCTCRDFNINVVSKRKYNSCYHLIAQVIAETLGLEKNIKCKYTTILKILSEIIDKEESITLRRLLLKQ